MALYTALVYVIHSAITDSERS